MKILFLTRSTLYKQPGGDTLQVDQTATYLRLMGCEVHISLREKISEKESYDIIHFFNLIRPADAKSALKQKAPLVISSIYHDYREYDILHRSGLASTLGKMLGNFRFDYLKTVFRWLNSSDKFPGWNYLIAGQKNSMLHLLKKSSYLVSTSQQELDLIERDLGYLPPHKKVSLGSEHIPTCNSSGNRVGVLCAARIEGPKNQLSLIKALQGTGISLTLTGQVATNQKAYFTACQQAANSDVRFTGRISSDNLQKEFCQAKVHALVSYYETTGLATLEAMKAGCQVVVGNRGPQQELFGDKAEYCEPDNVESIKKAVLNALDKNEDHRKWVEENFSWKRSAQQILDIYQSLVKEN